MVNLHWNAGFPKKNRLRRLCNSWNWLVVWYRDVIQHDIFDNCTMMKITFFVVTSQRWWTNNVSSATLRDYERAQAEIKMLQQQKAHILDESKNLKTTVHVMEKVPPAIPYDERSDEFESRHALQKMDSLCAGTPTSPCHKSGDWVQKRQSWS